MNILTDHQFLTLQLLNIPATYITGVYQNISDYQKSFTYPEDVSLYYYYHNKDKTITIYTRESIALLLS